ncbi:flagellar biosynthesis protein FlhF [Ornithinibacillus halophilus]|uniref:Flagellar biosynthesis protein FlhF n=1 Tax=Ornithinibacillus halophilus TaxID=930117 RepID=A0A1M5CB29_9BACI|nr:flagellar biosynthesis protein FlhF [Ornithinibacillus halophilus]SHF51974.1 flagellar biosynthesis protein FlhF [Ornithinibacillus halophilus]
MKVKKYIATTMPEAMKQIRKELGKNAVILNSKEIQEGGFLGLFKKRKIEVIAALDEMPNFPKQNKKPDIREQKEKIKNNYSDNRDILNELKHLKQLVQLQADSNNKFELEFQVFYQHLIEQEVSPPIAEQLIRQTQEKNPSLKDAPVEEIREALQKEIEQSLEDTTFSGLSYNTKIVQFVGPTGVGKTTSIAKIAANSMLNDKKSVAFITMDTYRIAAIEQLKTYAQILDVPVEVAYSLEDYNEAIIKLSHYDLILVDTAGRNFRDEQYVKELKDSMNENLAVETFLVLSLTAKPKDILEIYDSFDKIPIKEVIFTKLDETTQYGSMLNICLEKQTGIAYLTNGQDVPDDILNPSPSKISEMIVGESINGRSSN